MNTHLYGCYLCDRWPAGHRILSAVRREKSSYDASSCSAPSVWNVTSWKWTDFFFSGDFIFFFTKILKVLGINFWRVTQQKMVRFIRLTSWRSWDQLQVDSEIPESPPADEKPSYDWQVSVAKPDDTMMGCHFLLLVLRVAVNNCNNVWTR